MRLFSAAVAVFLLDLQNLTLCFRLQHAIHAFGSSLYMHQAAGGQ
ncbi:hypothetical protein ACP70R_002769 [Stipagrostis hirtigluma subsp. patula]